MAMPKVTVVKKSRLKGATNFASPSQADPVVDFVIIDGEDCSFTINGKTASGKSVDISAVATLTPVPTSSDPTILSLDPPVGMTDLMHALKASVPGTPVHLTISATWTDGSFGPYTIDWPVDVKTDPVTGLVVVPGTPTVR